MTVVQGSYCLYSGTHMKVVSSRRLLLPLRRHLYNDLSNMMPRCKIFDSFHRIFKRKHAIDMGPQLIRLNKAKHIRVNLL